MSTFIIGDVQGCYDELQALLTKIEFNPEQDTLWFTGDLVNRGPNSLEVLRLLSQLPNANSVLGNHDLSLLAFAYCKAPIKQHTFDDVVNAPDRETLLTWLRNRPLLHYDPEHKFVLTHAGLPPQWNLQQAKTNAREVEDILRGADFKQLLLEMYGNEPRQWQDDLIGWPRYRFIINALTRLRFCDLQGAIELQHKGAIGSQPAYLLPWYKIPDRANKNIKIIFGHWASLDGYADEPNVFPLDTGCVWGRRLTAMRIEDGQLFALPCLRSNVKKL
jgi:bis(5'-nucleosyl)-tetraphosphatase (symmetrical)